MKARLDNLGIATSLDEVGGDTGEYIGYSLDGARPLGGSLPAALAVDACRLPSVKTRRLLHCT